MSFCPTKNYIEQLADAITSHNDNSEFAMRKAEELAYKLNNKDLQLWLTGKESDTIYLLNDEQLRYLKEYSLLLNNDGTDTKPLADLINGFTTYQINVKNNKFPSVDVEQAFVDFTVSSLYNVLSQRRRVYESDAADSKFTIKPIADVTNKDLKVKRNSGLTVRGLMKDIAKSYVLNAKNAEIFYAKLQDVIKQHGIGSLDEKLTKDLINKVYDYFKSTKLNQTFSERVETQYKELQNVTSFKELMDIINNKLDKPIYNLLDKFIEDIESNISDNSIIQQALDQLNSSYKIDLRDDVSVDGDVINPLTRNYDDKKAYSRDVEGLFHRDIINTINGLLLTTVNDKGEVVQVRNPHTNLVEYVKWIDVATDLKMLLADSVDTNHFMQKLKLASGKYTWLTQLINILEKPENKDLLDNFEITFKNTLTSEHVSLLTYNATSNSYDAVYRVISPMVETHFTNLHIGPIMDIRNNPNRIQEVLLQFKATYANYVDLVNNSNKHLSMEQKIDKLFEYTISLLNLYDIETNKALLHKVLKGELIEKYDNKLTFGNAISIMSDNFIKPINNINEQYKNTVKFDEFGNINTIARAYTKYIDTHMDGAYKTADSETKFVVKLPNGISEWMKLLSKASLGETYQKELEDYFISLLAHPGLANSNWLVTSKYNNNIIQGFLNKTIVNGQTQYKLNKDYIKQITATINGGIKNTASLDGATFGDLTNKDNLISQIVMFMNLKQNEKDGKLVNKDGMIWKSLPKLSDSTTDFALYLQRLAFHVSTKDVHETTIRDVEYNSENDTISIEPNSDITNILFKVFMQEYETMLYEQDYMFKHVPQEDGSIKLELYENINDKTLIEDYHYTVNKKTGEREYFKDGKLAGNVFKFHNFKEINNIIKFTENGFQPIASLTSAQLTAIYKAINTEMNNEINAIYQQLKDVRTVLPTSSTYGYLSVNSNLAKLATEAAVNNFIHNIEIQNFLLGTQAEYADETAMTKRAKIISTPGKMLNLKKDMTIITLEDVKIPVLSLKYIENVAELELEKRGINKNSILYKVKFDEIVEGYKKTTATDGQTFYSTDFYVETLKAKGVFNQYSHLFTTYSRKGVTHYRIKPNVPLDELTRTITVVKCLIGDRDFKPDTFNHITPKSNQIKTSAFPISSTMFKDTYMSEIADWMNEEGISFITFRSSQKQTKVNITNAIDENKVLNVETLKTAKRHVIDKSAYREVLDVVDHTQDHENKAGIQIMKHIFANLARNEKYEFKNHEGKELTGEEIFTLGQDLITSNIKESANELFKELGLTYGEDGYPVITDKTKLSKVLENDIKTRKYSNVELMSILLDNDGEFQLPLFFSTFNKRWQNVLTALFTNNITNQKLPGSHLVLISNVLKGSSIDTEKRDLKAVLMMGDEVVDDSKYTKEDYKRHIDNGGKIILECLISPFSKAFFDDNGQLMDINQLPKEILENIGYRIPTSAKHSAVVLKAVGWIDTPYSAGIIVSDEIINKTGTDFDVDSLYLIHRHFNKIKNADGTYTFEAVSYKQTDNELYENYIKHNAVSKFKEYKDNYKNDEDVQELYSTFKENNKSEKERFFTQFEDLYNYSKQIFKQLSEDTSEYFRKLHSTLEFINLLPAEKVYVNLALAELHYNNVNTSKEDKAVLVNLMNSYNTIIALYDQNPFITDAYKEIYQRNLKELKGQQFKLIYSKILQDIAKFEKLESFEEFSKREYIDKLSKEQKDNYLIDMMQSILSSKHHALETIRPAVFPESTFMEKLFNTDMKGNPAYMSTQLKYRNALLDGKASLSIAASTAASIPVYQNVGGRLFQPITFTYLLDTAENRKKYARLKERMGDAHFNRLFLPNNIDVLKTKYNVISVEDGKVVIAHDKIGHNNIDTLNIENSLITDTVGELVNHTVDVTKNVLPNNLTVDTIMNVLFMESLGMRPYDAFTLLQLPVITELLKDVSSFKSITSENSYSAFSNLKNKYATRIRDCYVALKREDGFLTDARRALSKEKGIYLSNTELELLLSDNSFKFTLSSADLMSAALFYDKTQVIPERYYTKEGFNKLGNFKKDKLESELERYIELLKMLRTIEPIIEGAGIMSKINNAISTDKKGISPTLLDAHNYVSDIHTAAKIGYIKDELATQTILDKNGSNIVQGIFTFSNDKEIMEQTPSTYNSFKSKFINGIDKPFNTLKDLFISETPLFTNTYTEDGDNIGLFQYFHSIFNHVKINLRNKLINNVYVYAMQHLMLSIPVFNMNKFEAETILGLTVTDANSKFNSLSTAKKIKHLKAQMKLKPTENHILNKIEVRDSDFDKQTYIVDKINLVSIEDIKLKNKYAKQLTDMYFSGNYKQKSVVVDLIKYSFLTDGLLFSSNNITQLIEPIIWQDLNVTKELRAIHNNAKQPNSIQMLPPLHEFMYSFMRNNLHNTIIAPSMPINSLQVEIKQNDGSYETESLIRRGKNTYATHFILTNKQLKSAQFSKISNSYFFTTYDVNPTTNKVIPIYYERIAQSPTLKNKVVENGKVVTKTIPGRTLFVRVEPLSNRYFSDITVDTLTEISEEKPFTTIMNTPSGLNETAKVRLKEFIDTINTKYNYIENPLTPISIFLGTNHTEETEEDDTAPTNNKTNDNKQFHRINKFPILSESEQIEHGNRLKQRFAEAGVKVEVVWEAIENGNAFVENRDGIITVVVDPRKAKQDSIYHEFGHILIDMAVDQDFIQAGIEQLKGSELWNNIAELYPHLTEEQLGREVLTTAVGIEAASSYNNNSKWLFWFNRLLQRISNFIYKITFGKLGNDINVAKELAIRLTRGDLRLNIKHELSMQKQWQKDANYSDELEKIHNVLELSKDTFTGLFYKHQYDTSEMGESIRKDVQLLDTGVNLDNLRKNINTIGTANALAITHKLLLNQLTRFEANVIKNLRTFGDRSIDPRSWDENKMKRLGEDLYEISDFLANMNNMENIDLSVLTLEGEPTTEEKSLYTGYVALNNIVQDIKQTTIPRVKEIQLRYNELSNILRVWIISNTSNPDVVDFFKAAKETQFDDNLFQSTFLSIGDSHHIVVANLAKIINREYEKRDKAITRMTRGFLSDLDKFKKAGGNIKDLYNEFGQLHQQYNVQQFFDDMAEYVNQPAVIDSKGRTILKSKGDLKKEFIQNSGTSLTHEQLEEIINDELERVHNGEITYNQYGRWFDKNIKIYYDNYGGYTYYPNIKGEYYTMIDKYRNIQYDNIMSNTINKDMYNSIKTLYDTLFKNLGTQQANYFLANIASNKGKQELKDKGEWYEQNTDTVTEEIINANNDVVHTIPLSYTGLIAAQPLLHIRKRFIEESVYEYERNILAYLQQQYNLTFKTLKEAKDYNKEIALNNKKRHGQAVNYNLEEVIPALITSVLNYKHKKDIEGIVLATGLNIKHEQLANKDGFGKPILKKARQALGIKEKPATKSAESSRLYKHLMKQLEMTFYEKFKRPSKGDGIIKAMIQYQSFLGMGFNLHSGVKNVTFGTAQTLLLAGQGHFYTNTGLKAAERLYNEGLQSYINDTKRSDLKYTSFANALIHEFNIISAYTSSAEFDEQTTAQYGKLMLTKAAFFMQEAGEHMLQNKLLLAMLHDNRIIDGKITTLQNIIDSKLKSITVQNIRNKEVTKENIKELKKTAIAEATEIFNKGTKLLDIYEFKDNVLEVKDEFKQYENLLLDFKQKVRGVSHKLHGIYNKEDKGTIENTYLGSALMQFRRWMPAGYVNRFGTRGGPFKVEAFWNERREEYDLGTYTSLMKYLGLPVKDLQLYDSSKPVINATLDMFKTLFNSYGHFLSNYRLYYETLTPQEQAEAKRAIYELGTVVALAILLMMLKAGLDDEDKLKKNAAIRFGLYQLDSLKTEMATYIPVIGWLNETNKFIKSPMPIYSLGVKILTVGYDVLAYPIRGEENYFKGGNYHKQLKLKVHTGKALPGITQYIRIFEDKSDKMYKMWGN